MKGINSEGGEVEVIIEFEKGIICNICSIAAQLSFKQCKYLARIYHPVGHQHGTI